MLAPGALCFVWQLFFAAAVAAADFAAGFDDDPDDLEAVADVVDLVAVAGAGAASACGFTS